MITKKTLFAGLLAIAVGVTAAACADGPNAPTAATGPRTPQEAVASASKGVAGLPTVAADADVKVKGMKRSSKIATTSASATIGVLGGFVHLPDAGVALYVPPGAVKTATKFKITTTGGELAAYDFEPAGAQFSVPLLLVQDKAALGVTSTDAQAAQLAYFSDDSKLDETDLSALASQLRAPVSALTDRYLVFPVWHFSGYIVCWGRR